MRKKIAQKNQTPKNPCKEEPKTLVKKKNIDTHKPRILAVADHGTVLLSALTEHRSLKNAVLSIAPLKQQISVRISVKCFVSPISLRIQHRTTRISPLTSTTTRSLRIPRRRIGSRDLDRQSSC